MSKLRVFVSSVQKELANERLAVATLVTTDPFLNGHCEPVLYEFEPALPEKALKGCLKSVDSCDIFVVIVWREYGKQVRSASITHHEYRRAKRNGLPILAYIKGPAELVREAGTERLLKEIVTDGLKYKRFENYRELQTEVRASLIRLLKERYGIEPSSDENESAEQTIEAASPFGTQTLDRVSWKELDFDLARQLVAAAEAANPKELSRHRVLRSLISRGLVWTDVESGEHYATAAGVVLLANDPSVVFPQCRVLANAFYGTEKTSKPDDYEDIRAPMPTTIERAWDFVQRNTRHPMRVVGLNRVQLDEYPAEAVREALVNAVAHRNYELAGQKVILDVFSDRVVVSSPGMPPKPLTIQKLRSGNYMPCSRNPAIAQGLSFFHRIDERGCGLRRMGDEMLDHGLDPPRLATSSGFFQVIFPGPGTDLGRLRVREAAAGHMVTPSVEAKLNERQKKIVACVLAEGSVTRRWCTEEFNIANDTAGRDLGGLVNLRVLAREGKGSATRYVLFEKEKHT